MSTDERRKQRLSEAGAQNVYDNLWLPIWKALGYREVAAQVAARRGPAVEDSAKGLIKLTEAYHWVLEEIDREERERAAERIEAQDERRITQRRATVSFWLSILAACVSLASLVIAAGALLQKGTG